MKHILAHGCGVRRGSLLKQNYHPQESGVACLKFNHVNWCESRARVHQFGEGLIAYRTHSGIQSC